MFLDSVIESLISVTSKVIIASISCIWNRPHRILLIPSHFPLAVRLLEIHMLLKKGKIEREVELEQFQRDRETVRITESEVRKPFGKICEKFQSGELHNINQIIDGYVQKIVIHPETVVVNFNFFPKVNLAMAYENTEGCDYSQTLASSLSVLSQTLTKKRGRSDERLAQ